MGQLGEDAGREIMDGPRHGPEAFDEPVLEDAGLSGAGLSVGQDIEMAGDEQTDFTFRQFSIKRGQTGSGRAVLLGHIFVGRRADEPIGDREAAYFCGREEDRIGMIIGHAGRPWRRYIEFRFPAHFPIIYIVDATS